MPKPFENYAMPMMKLVWKSFLPRMQTRRNENRLQFLVGVSNYVQWHGR
jgi:hypothetical protein